MTTTEILDRAEISGTNVIVKYSKTEGALAELRGKYAGVAFDLTTTKGDKEARAARLELVTLRTSLEKKRKEFKAPALDLGGKIDSEAKRVTAEIVALETFIDLQIKADEKRRADEKEEKERIEAVRVQGLRDKIATIRGFVAKCQGISADRIANGIELVSKIDTGASVFSELEGEALAAQVETLQAMRTMHATTAAREAEAAEVEAQRVKNERVAAEQKLQADALAVQQEAIDKAAAELKEEKDKLAKEQADKDAAAKASSDAISKAQELASKPVPAAVVIAPIATETIAVKAPVCDSVQVGTFSKQEEDTGATMRLGQISERLGFTITADFLSSLGFEPCATEKNAKFYKTRLFPRICAALVRHIQSVCELQAA